MTTLIHATQSGGGFQDWSKALPDVWVEKTYIEELRARLVVGMLGREATLQENNGKVVRWLFVDNPAADATALAEAGEPTNSTDFTLNNVQATLAEFGGYSDFSKFLVKVAISGTMERIIKGLGYKGALSIDTYCLGSNVLGGGSPQSVNSGASMTADALRQAYAKISNAGAAAAAVPRGAAQPHPSTPGGAFYCFAGSPEACIDMIGEGAPTWSQAKNEQIESNLRTPLQGTPPSSALYQSIVKISENIPRDTTTSPDDDQNYLLGADAFGTAFMPGSMQNPVEVRITMPDERVDLRLRNKGHAAYWFLFGAARIDTNRYVRVLSDATGIG